MRDGGMDDEGLLTQGRIPISKIGDCLLVVIQTDLDDALVMDLQEDLTKTIVKTRARGTLIDISALDVVDTFTGRMLGAIAQMVSILDAACVLVGMRPAVAITLVELDMPLRTVPTAMNLDKGLRLVRERLGPAPGGR